MLKPLILSLALLATPLTAETEDVCANMGDAAEAIMSLRQNGYPISDLMDKFGDSNLFRAIILSAYEKPRFSTDEYKQESVRDFRNEVETLCYSM